MAGVFARRAQSSIAALSASMTAIPEATATPNGAAEFVDHAFAPGEERFAAGYGAESNGFGPAVGAAYLLGPAEVWRR